MNLQGKTVLVTGASRGIGAAIAQRLAEQGARVFGTATTPQGAERITSALQAIQADSVGLTLDVTDVAACEAAIDQCGGPDILINNAAITRDNLLLRLKDEDFEQVLATNLTALARMSRLALKPMMKRRWGRIINISSVVGSSGNPGQTNYAAAKAGVLGFSKSLAQEIASRNITVNVIAPGFIDTDMTSELSETQRTELQKKIPCGRLGMPEDIASAASFLASEEASYITGQTLHVNGGMLMP